MALRHSTLSSLFSDIADAIRAKIGGSSTIVADDFDLAIADIVTDPSGDCTATDADILLGKTAYAANALRTGTIPTKTTSDLSASGATVTVPAGYYASQATKSVASGSAKTPATTKAQSTPTITVSSAGLITASVAATSVSVTPTVTAGYVSTGTAGTVTMSASSATKQLATQAAKTVTPSTSAQTAVASGVYTTGAITVAAIPTETKTATANGDVTPTSGKYLTKVTVAIPSYTNLA